MQNAKIHMVCGMTGAGKSTYSEKLRTELGGVRFSIDEWNARLFFVDRSPTSDFNWFYERVQRCCAQMREVSEQILAVDIPVIFDCGFTNLKERTIFYEWAAELGHGVVLHHLDVPMELCWQRVQKRNAERGETFAMEVDRGMFEFMQNIWSAPDEAELAEHNGIVISN
ncbi:MAG: AAA family ATPase [Marinosulfonomonas sp.]